MKIKYVLFIILAITSTLAISSVGVEGGRTIYDGEISDSGHHWAGYAQHCEGNFKIEFNFKNLTGGAQANLNLNGSNRYAIGFINMENGSLAIYLFRQKNENVKQIPGKTIDFDPLATYHVEITSQDGEIQALIGGMQNGKGIKVIDYIDSDPLPSGKIDFETLEHSSVQLREVIVNCEAPVEETPPNLGAGHFKPPI